jgi:MFS transporter, ACS family, hexuronate transporter
MRWIVLLLLFLSYIINYADKAVIGYSAEPLMNELGLDDAQWGIIGSSFFWLFAVAGLIGGTLSDRYGTSRLIVIMLFGWTFLQFGSYFIMSLSMLIVYRVLLGAFEGPFGPSAMSHASKWFPPELRGLAFSILIAGASIGGIISAPILVALIESYGWRLTFAMLGGFSLVIVLAWMLVEWKSKKADSSLLSKAPVPKLKWSEVAPVLRHPACFLTLALSFSAYWLITWLVVWSPLYLTKVVKLEPMHMAYAIAGSGLVSTLVMLATSSISDRVFKRTQSYRKSRVWFSGFSTLVGGLSLAVLPVIDSFLWIFVALCIAKASTYISTTIGPQIMIRLMPERSGFIVSIFTFVTNIASMIAPIITGLMVQAAGNDVARGFHYSIYVMVGMFILTGSLFLLFVKPDEVPTTISTVAESA